MEAYIDDMVIKSRQVEELLREHKLRLNAAKCSFGVSSGKFLGYMITHCKIEVNPSRLRLLIACIFLKTPQKCRN